jgi:hypothetical protein
MRCEHAKHARTARKKTVADQQRASRLGRLAFARSAVQNPERPREARPLEANRRLPTLPGGCPPSTIGASGLNFSVRNGKRCFPAAMTAEVVRALRVVAHPQNSIAPHAVFKIKTSSN